VWRRHWKLSRDPFLGPGSAYVPITSHQEALARLVHTVEAGERLAILRAAAGLGKTTVLARALAELRSPARKIARISSPHDGEALLAGLAEGLGARVLAGGGRSAAWRALNEAIRLSRWQGLHVVLAIDHWPNPADPSGGRELDRLVHLDPQNDDGLTILQVLRAEKDEEMSLDPWQLTIGLAPLMLVELEYYVSAKLSAAGRDEPTFTPRALKKLHALSGGNPRGVDRLASLALMAGAWRGLEIVTPEVIDGVAQECTLPA